MTAPVVSDLVDVRVEHLGGLYLVQPLTPAAWGWLEAKTSDEALWLAGALVVESRYARDVVAGMLDAGFTVGSRPDFG